MVPRNNSLMMEMASHDGNAQPSETSGVVEKAIDGDGDSETTEESINKVRSKERGDCRCSQSNQSIAEPSQDVFQARNAQSRFWMQECMNGNTTIRKIVTVMGSVDEVILMFKYVMEHGLAETLVVDILIDLWKIFPEVARKQLDFFRIHGYWQHLFLVLETSWKRKVDKRLPMTVYELLKKQWLHDIKMLKDANEGSTEQTYKGGIARFALGSKDASVKRKFAGTLLRIRKNQKNYFGEEHRLPSVLQGPEMYKSCLSFSSDDFDDSIDHLLLPTEGRVDHYFFRQPTMRQAIEKFLKKPLRHFDSKSSERVLYIHQGEAGFATASQCDVIMSDRATTCHILAMRSTMSGPSLFSLAHIDGPIYHDCIAKMVETHVQYHCKGGQRGSKRVLVDFVIDIVGGFDDDRGSSADISSWLFATLSYFADEYRELIKLQIRTCAISCLNDNGSNVPIGRGMGVNLRTGEAFLASADLVITPAMQLRSARIWCDGGRGQLSIVHTSSKDTLVIHPFPFDISPRTNSYLKLSDEDMIQRTSTSPDQEEEGFCDSVRCTLRFMKIIDCHEVFGPQLNEACEFRRVASSNVWRRVPVL